MRADFTAGDLRALADMVDRLNDATTSTGVTVHGYSGEHLMLNDQQIRLNWHEPAGETTGHYTVEYPDGM